jgi:hypothetical protein
MIVLFGLSFLGGLTLMWGLDYLSIDRGYWSCYGAFFMFGFVYRYLATYVQLIEEIPKYVAIEQRKNALKKVSK